MTEGVLNVLKPPGMTSSDVVGEIRRIYQMKRVGHTGTLDPGAAGVLPICLGRATRLFDYLVDKQKEYLAELFIGWETDTQDAYGAAVRRSERRVGLSEISGILPAFVGEQDQTAPLYSAVRVEGKQMYKLARSGVRLDPADRKIRRIRVDGLELLGQTGEDRFLLRISCGKGTYVRTLCQDIAAALGTAGHMSYLLRVKSGDFRIEGAYTLEELRQMTEAELQAAPVSMEAALHRLPAARLELDEGGARRLLNGASVPFEGAAGAPHRVYCNGVFCGIGLRESQGFHLSVYLKEEHG